MQKPRRARVYAGSAAGSSSVVVPVDAELDEKAEKPEQRTNHRDSGADEKEKRDQVFVASPARPMIIKIPSTGQRMQVTPRAIQHKLNKNLSMRKTIPHNAASFKRIELGRTVSVDAGSAPGFVPGAEVFMGNVSVSAEEQGDEVDQPIEADKNANRVEHSASFASASGESTKSYHAEPVSPSHADRAKIGLMKAHGDSSLPRIAQQIPQGKCRIESWPSWCDGVSA